MKPEKRSVALAILHPVEPGRILTVLRPEDDEELPSTWGLPAASLRPGESWEEAARRAGREKLGVEVRIDGRIGEDRMERPAYVLHMREYAAAIEEGQPEVGRPAEGVTRYTEWEWAGADRLVPAARAGSLCSRIFLRSRGREW